MATLGELRKSAKEMGIAAAVIRSATSAEELQSIIADHGSGSKAPAKKKGGAVVKKKKTATVAKKKSAAEKKRATTTVKKRNSKSASSKSAPAKSKKKSGTAKRQTTAKRSSAYVPKGGRNLLDGVDFTADEGWNARAGSAPDRIVKALRKFRGNRGKVFDFLKSDLYDFVGRKNAKGDKRSKAEAENMLKYRISRTAWDFARRTGQHEVAGNRVEYGTGGTGTGVYKPKRSAGRKTNTTGRKKTASASKRKSATTSTKRKPAAAKRGGSKRKTGSRRK